MKAILNAGRDLCHPVVALLHRSSNTEALSVPKEIERDESINATSIDIEKRPEPFKLCLRCWLRAIARHKSDNEWLHFPQQSGAGTNECTNCDVNALQQFFVCDKRPETPISRPWSKCANSNRNISTSRGALLSVARPSIEREWTVSTLEE